MHAAVRMTGSRHDAEDLMQETYVRVMRRPRLLRNADDLGYLMRTLRNTWLNQCRSRGAEARAVEESAAMLERARTTTRCSPSRFVRCSRRSRSCRRSTATRSPPWTRLGYVQSAVSQQQAFLEPTLGVRLVDRE